mmetsp:Transcript_49640/g.142356  ORF Transcript_49640/g.142356 Transcript_49640/m.142356 type:complete len:347 (+) Transcript_49640:122-1162(+)
MPQQCVADGLASGSSGSAPHRRSFSDRWSGKPVRVALVVFKPRVGPSAALDTLYLDVSHHAIVLVLEEVAMCDHFPRELVDVHAHLRLRAAHQQHRVVPIPHHVVGIVPNLHDLVRVDVQVEGVEANARDCPLLHLAHLDRAHRRRCFVAPNMAFPIKLDSHGVEHRHVDRMPVALHHLRVPQIRQVARPPDAELLHRETPRRNVRGPDHLDVEQLVSGGLHRGGMPTEAHGLPQRREIQLRRAWVPRGEATSAPHGDICTAAGDEVDAVHRPWRIVKVDAILRQELVLAKGGVRKGSGGEDFQALLDGREDEAQAVPHAVLQLDLGPPLTVHDGLRLQTRHVQAE